MSECKGGGYSGGKILVGRGEMIMHREGDVVVDSIQREQVWDILACGVRCACGEQAAACIESCRQGCYVLAHRVLTRVMITRDPDTTRCTPGQAQCVQSRWRGMRTVASQAPRCVWKANASNKGPGNGEMGKDGKESGSRHALRAWTPLEEFTRAAASLPAFRDSTRQHHMPTRPRCHRATTPI